MSSITSVVSPIAESLAIRLIQSGRAADAALEMTEFDYHYERLRIGGAGVVQAVLQDFDALLDCPSELPAAVASRLQQ